ncbi:MAG TPA: hypothetical protein PKY77_09880 [Phycisphaerae bacterium]|nr:hypothetical protein [Phycisphaerae bacterium]HRY68133.1 hypothetical protein [Phycisphaerae bacterium]HSA28784.1 hypothetical protein [Phycisphaerae bacterium]
MICPFRGRTWKLKTVDALRIEQLVLPRSRRRVFGERIWREWCFARTLGRQCRWRLLAIVLILLGGGLLFQRLEPSKRLSLPAATFYTWSLVFGQAPEEFPPSRILQAMFFVVPILGLTVILEGIVDLALMAREGLLARTTIGDFCETHGLGIVEHRPAGGEPRLFPGSGTRLQPGDEVVAQGSFEVLRRLKDAV